MRQFETRDLGYQLRIIDKLCAPVAHGRTKFLNDSDNMTKLVTPQEIESTTVDR